MAELNIIDMRDDKDPNLFPHYFKILKYSYFLYRSCREINEIIKIQQISHYFKILKYSYSLYQSCREINKMAGLNIIGIRDDQDSRNS